MMVKKFLETLESPVKLKNLRAEEIFNFSSGFYRKFNFSVEKLCTDEISDDSGCPDVSGQEPLSFVAVSKFGFEISRNCGPIGCQ